MENRKILLYVLHGAWDTQGTDGVEVIGVSENIEPLQKKLEKIADSQAKDYIKTYGEEEEERGERYYEIIDALGEYAKFYITEHYVDISETLMGAISREMEKIDRRRDVENYLQGMWESDNLDNWKFEYMINCDDVMQKIIERFDKTEDCNISFNATLENAVEFVAKDIALDDGVIEFLWRRLGEIPVDDDGYIQEDYMGYDAGTDREEIWEWFDEHYSGGISALMYGRYGK